MARQILLDLHTAVLSGPPHVQCAHPSNAPAIHPLHPALVEVIRRVNKPHQAMHVQFTHYSQNQLK